MEERIGRTWCALCSSLGIACKDLIVWGKKTKKRKRGKEVNLRKNNVEW